MAEVFTQTAPAATQAAPVAPVQAPVVETPKEDLITRASKVSLDNPKEAVKPEESKFDVNEISKIADPVARKLAEDAYKSFQADYTKKTQALAAERKQMESLKQQLEASGQYTPERIHSMLNDPSFIRAAQEYQRMNGVQQDTTQATGNGDLTQEEFSYLTPEQQKLYVKTKQMEQSLNVVNTRLQASEVEKQDMSLKSKYANYDPNSVNEIYQGLMTGRVQATREHLWKVQDYDAAVERAYRLGLQDRKLEMGEKINASSNTNGVSVTPSGDVPVRQAHESGVEYFKRIALNNASKLMKK